MRVESMIGYVSASCLTLWELRSILIKIYGSIYVKKMRVLEIEKDNAEEFKLKYKQKGYLFKCRYPSQQLEFTLEVCRIRKMELTGVKSKRLKGDLWVYKDYCQRIVTKLRL